MNLPVDTLFYDARCPLCQREVALLQRLADSTLAFQDIHATHDDDIPSKEALLKSLHLLRGNGDMVTGLAANVAVWQHTRFGFLWRVLMLPGIHAGAEWVYRRWAQRRYDRLYGCMDVCVAVCGGVCVEDDADAERSACVTRSEP